MILYGLRLLVALLTFFFGVAATRLFDFKPAPVPAGHEVTTTAVLVADKSLSCPLERSGTIFGGVLESKTIDERSHVYPASAKKVRIGGKVDVKVEVDEEGRVTKARAVTGYGMLPGAAVNDALATRFPPTRLSGKPVRVSGLIRYDFVLD